MTWLARIGHWFADYAYWLTSPWRRPLDRDDHDIAVLHRITNLEERMDLTDSALADLDAATNAVADELDELRDELESVDASVAARIGEKASRLRALAADPENPVPTPADPDPEVPAEPAPADEPTPPAA